MQGHTPGEIIQGWWQKRGEEFQLFLRLLSCAGQINSQEWEEYKFLPQEHREKGLRTAPSGVQALLIDQSWQAQGTILPGTESWVRPVQGKGISAGVSLGPTHFSFQKEQMFECQCHQLKKRMRPVRQKYLENIYKIILLTKYLLFTNFIQSTNN